MEYTGHLTKLSSKHNTPVDYYLPVGNQYIHLNPFLGKTVSFQYLGAITCIHCGRKTNKSFSQGYCFPCARTLAECDMCIVKPELCHYQQGTCREPAWGEAHCLQPHIIYIANSSHIKVGITRKANIPTRWIDQGAKQALAIFEVKSRYESGIIEKLLSRHISDKTNWRDLLKGNDNTFDLYAKRDELLKLCQNEINLAPLSNATEFRFEYPILNYPKKIASLSFDSQPKIEGVLEGIKGQYLLFSHGALNIRKHTGYNISFQA